MGACCSSSAVGNGAAGTTAVERSAGSVDGGSAATAPQKSTLQPQPRGSEQPSAGGSDHVTGGSGGGDGVGEAAPAARRCASSKLDGSGAGGAACAGSSEVSSTDNALIGTAPQPQREEEPREEADAGQRRGVKGLPDSQRFSSDSVDIVPHVDPGAGGAFYVIRKTEDVNKHYEILEELGHGQVRIASPASCMQAGNPVLMDVLAEGHVHESIHLQDGKGDDASRAEKLVGLFVIAAYVANTRAGQTQSFTTSHMLGRMPHSLRTPTLSYNKSAHTLHDHSLASTHPNCSLASTHPNCSLAPCMLGGTGARANAWQSRACPSARPPPIHTFARTSAPRLRSCTTWAATRTLCSCTACMRTSTQSTWSWCA
eukprot:354687-Chlamydomonas_euryale.AAC.1